MMEHLLESQDKNIVFFLTPVDSSALFEDVHKLIFKEPEVFFEEKIREEFPVVLVVEGLNSTEFNITHQKPDKKYSFVLIPGSGRSLINT